MSCRVVTTTPLLSWISTSDTKKPPKIQSFSCPGVRIRCSSSIPDLPLTTGNVRVQLSLIFIYLFFKNVFEYFEIKA